MTIYTLRTTSGREDIVIDILSSRIKRGGGVKSIFHPAEIKGYIFIEGDLASIHKATQSMMHIRGLIEKPIRFEEIQHFLESKRAKLSMSIGDTAEIIGGPFKGEKGQIKRIDKSKDEVTIELLEATIPIPVTISTEFIKIIKKAKPEEEPAGKPPKREEPQEEKPEDERSIFERPVEQIDMIKEKSPIEKIKDIEKKMKGEEETKEKELENVEAEKKEVIEMSDHLEKEEAYEDVGAEKESLLDELEKEEKAKKDKKKKEQEPLE